MTHTPIPHQLIPLVDLKAQYRAIQPAIDAAIADVVQNTSFIMGPPVRDFEAAWAAFCGATHAVGISSGTAALELTLRALDIGPGDEVITVAHTFIATAEAISAVGATPVLVDIDPCTYTMEPAQTAAAITPATRALIPVHLYGQPADLTRLIRIACEHDLALVEDAAQAHGATWCGHTIGDTTNDVPSAACFSFYPGKNLGAYGDAGAVTTNDEALAHKVAMLRNHGRTDKYLHEIKGFGERIDTLQAAILAAKLPHLAAWTQSRRRLAARYDSLLADLPLHLPQVAPEAQSAWHLYVVRVQPAVDTPDARQSLRDGLLAHLQAHGIGAGIHYPIPLHLQPAYADLGLTRGDLPITERVADTCVSLPLYPELTETQQDRVVETARGFFEGR